MYIHATVTNEWDVNETRQIFRRKLEIDYFRKTTQPFKCALKKSFLG